MSFGSKEYAPIALALVAMRDRATADLNRLHALHPTWIRNDDPRLNVFLRLINVWIPTLLGLTLEAKQLEDRAWWDEYLKTPTGPMPERDRWLMTAEYLTFIRRGFLLGTATTIENCLRALLRAIDPLACNSGTGEFRNIYECLIKTKLSHAPANAMDLLDLWRLIRNSQHNNGAHFSRRGTDDTVTYKGTAYVFRHGRTVNFLGWPLVLWLADDARHLLADIVADTVVSGLGPITDIYPNG